MITARALPYASVPHTITSRSARARWRARFVRRVLRTDFSLRAARRENDAVSAERVRRAARRGEASASALTWLEHHKAAHVRERVHRIVLALRARLARLHEQLRRRFESPRPLVTDPPKPAAVRDPIVFRHAPNSPPLPASLHAFEAPARS